MPLQATSGAASYDAFGGGVPVAANYIEDVFSTWLYTGNGATQTITNGIDLAGKGGLVWCKVRNTTSSNFLFDTARGANALFSNLTNGQQSEPQGITSFNANGFTLGTNGGTNGADNTFASWTFREQPKFFDVVTYTGNGTSQNIPHNLQSVPGFILIKATSTTSDWFVLARYDSSGGNTSYKNLRLNTTAASVSNSIVVDSSVLTSFPTNVFNGAVNTNGVSYVAYVFAHNAGGFGLSGTDNVISCGSFTTDSIGIASVTLGYEPQWLMVKRSDGVNNWTMKDVLRGSLTATVSGISAANLRANTADAESTNSNVNGFSATATGFYSNGNETTGSATYIYIAIRRGPMRTPTTGTSVFGLSARTGTGANATVTGSAGVTDLAIVKARALTPVWLWASRLTGTGYLSSNATTAETAAGTAILQANPWDVMDGVKVGINSQITNDTSRTYINYLIDRAPSFFDEVCYTSSANRNNRIAHNLTVTPELAILKGRNNTSAWVVYSAALGVSKYLYLQQTAVAASLTNAFPSPSATEFGFNALDLLSAAGTDTVVCYFFASCPGVSKVFSFTGNGSTQTINCGFTGGARFVLLKASSATGGWYVYDTARGMTVLTDPYLQLNSTAAETATLGSVTTVSTGFAVNEAITTGVNTNGVTYIGLAIS